MTNLSRAELNLPELEPLPVERKPETIDGFIFDRALPNPDAEQYSGGSEYAENIGSAYSSLVARGAGLLALRVNPYTDEKEEAFYRHPNVDPEEITRVISELGLISPESFTRQSGQRTGTVRRLSQPSVDSYVNRVVDSGSFGMKLDQLTPPTKKEK